MTQAWATIAAAVIALVAASFAYRGVIRTIEEQKITENRGRTLDLFDEAVVATETMSNLMIAISATTSDESRELYNERLMQQLERLSIIRAKFILYGLDEAGSAVKKYIDAYLDKDRRDKTLSELAGIRKDLMKSVEQEQHGSRNVKFDWFSRVITLSVQWQPK